MEAWCGVLLGGNGKINVLVADDDQVIRDLLVNYLQSFAEVNVVAAAADSAEAAQVAYHHKPDVIMLDICMPDENGLNLANRLRDMLPQACLIFITGHTEYAAQAFALEAVDYLVKPIRREHLARALSRAQKYLGRISCQPELKPVLSVKEDRQLFLIHPESILFLEKQGRKTIIHTESRRYNTGESLQSLAKRLGPEFFRCHRSFIVNVNRIETISTLGDRVYKVTFHRYPGEVTMCRQAYDDLCAIIAATGSFPA